MNRIVLPLLLVGLAGCYSLNDKDLARSKQDSLGTFVRSPMDLMVLNAKQPDREIGRVYFDYDKSELTADARQVLDSLVEEINRRTGPVLIEGRTDHMNTDEYNLTLGNRRAMTVAFYLRSAGVWDERLVVRSASEFHPSTSNWTDEGRAFNRCVVVSMYNQGEGMDSDNSIRAYRNSFVPETREASATAP